MVFKNSSFTQNIDWVIKISLIFPLNKIILWLDENSRVIKFIKEHFGDLKFFSQNLTIYEFLLFIKISPLKFYTLEDQDSGKVFRIKRKFSYN